MMELTPHRTTVKIIIIIALIIITGTGVGLYFLLTPASGPSTSTSPPTPAPSSTTSGAAGPVTVQMIVVAGTSADALKAQLDTLGSIGVVVPCATNTAAMCTTTDAATASAILTNTENGKLSSISSVTVTTPTTKIQAFSTQPWQTLSKTLSTCLTGIQVSFAGGPQYDTERFDMNHRVSVKPVAIAFPVDQAQVQLAVGCARAAGIKFTGRCGRHSYEAYSIQEGALVIDVSRMTAITAVDNAANTVWLEAGLKLGEVYAALSSYGRTLPGGTCPTVGLAGHTLGGGFGVRSRQYGLMVDHVLAIDIIDVNGRLISTSPSVSSDLFWALRGAGGGQFGIVTRFLFSTVPADPVIIFSYTFDTRACVALLQWLQSAIPSLPNEIWMQLAFVRSVNHIALNGQFSGSQTAFTAALSAAQFSSLGAPLTTTLTPMSYLDSVAFWGNVPIGGGAAALSAAAKAIHATQNWKTRSGFVMSDATSTAILSATVGAFFDGAFPAYNPWDAYLLVDTWGGATGKVAATDMAFAHRQSKMSAQLAVYWATGDAIETSLRAWQSGVWAALRPGLVGAYSNYADGDLVDYMKQYYDGNVDGLIVVKTRYDPTNVMSFPQSIPVNPAGQRV